MVLIRNVCYENEFLESVSQILWNDPYVVPYYHPKHYWSYAYLICLYVYLIPGDVPTEQKKRHKLDEKTRGEVERFFHSFIIEHRCPNKQGCLSAKEKIPGLQDIPWKNIKWMVRSLSNKKWSDHQLDGLFSLAVGFSYNHGIFIMQFICS